MKRDANMVVKLVKVSEKGQIALPMELRERIGIKKGDELIILQEDEKILLQKVKTMKKQMRREFDYLIKHSEKVFSKLWSNKKDELWNKV